MTIDLLDIFGFENFYTNSFEQLCINHANEKLHQLFLHTMFKAEEAIVARERVTLPPLEYCDNAKCLQLLEDAPHGIFHLLDTCCRVHATPASFTLQLHERHLPTSEFLVPTINGANEDRRFTVRHFAGDVTYTSEHFMAKNTETMEAQARQVLQARGLAFLRPILDQQRVAAAFDGGGGSGGGGGRGGAAAHAQGALAAPRAAAAALGGGGGGGGRRAGQGGDVDGAALPSRHGAPHVAARQRVVALCALRQAQRPRAAGAALL